jgi:hypothetical protein
VHFENVAEALGLHTCFGLSLLRHSVVFFCEESTLAPEMLGVAYERARTCRELAEG